MDHVVSTIKSSDKILSHVTFRALITNVEEELRPDKRKFQASEVHSLALQPHMDGIIDPETDTDNQLSLSKHTPNGAKYLALIVASIERKKPERKPVSKNKKQTVGSLLPNIPTRHRKSSNSVTPT